MDFRDRVENSRPQVVSEEEKLQQKNQKICDFVIEGVKESILEQARKCPKDGSLLNIRGAIYLGMFGDGMMGAAVESATTEVKSFFSFLSSNKTHHTIFKVSQNGEHLLKMMRSVAEKDNICIKGYLIGFGDTARSDSEETDGYVRGVKITNLFRDHTHTMPVEMKYTDHELSAYFLSPETNGVFKRYSDYRYPGLYVEYTYKG